MKNYLLKFIQLICPHYFIKKGEVLGYCGMGLEYYNLLRCKICVVKATSIRTGNRMRDLLQIEDWEN